MKIILGEPPNPKQQEFLRSRAKHTGYGGARGGGKSWSMRTKFILLASSYAGLNTLLLRRTYQEVSENHVVPLLRTLPRTVAKYNKSEHVFTFGNGSRLKLGYCAGEEDVYQFQGQEYDVIGMEEATQFSETQREFLTTCNRSPRSDFQARMYYTGNPGGVGHMWFRRLFIDRRYKAQENPNDYLFIPARVYDNAVLMKNDPDYVRTLENLPEDRRRAYLDGDWNVFSGQYFSEFRTDIHVTEPFEIPGWWTRYRAIDYGLDGAACVWAAFDASGDAYLYREYLKSDAIISQAAHDILDLTDESERIEETFAPADMKARTKETGRTQEELFWENGLYLSIVNQPRETGWLNLKEWMKTVDDGTGKRSRLVIFSTCKEIIEQLPQLQHDKKHPTDVSTEPHEITHLPDALRYLMAGRPQCPVVAAARDYDGAPSEARQVENFLEFGR